MKAKNYGVGSLGNHLANLVRSSGLRDEKSMAICGDRVSSETDEQPPRPAGSEVNRLYADAFIQALTDRRQQSPFDERLTQTIALLRAVDKANKISSCAI